MRQILLLPIIFLGLSILTSCSVNQRTANLKDAMKKSSNKYFGNRKVSGYVHKSNDSKNNDNFKKAEVRIITKPNPEKNKIVLFDSTYSKMVAFRFGTGFLNSKEFYGLSHFSFLKGVYSSKKHDAILFHFGLTQSPVQQTSDINYSISGGIFELSVGGEHRKYLTSSYVFLGNYLHVGGNLDFMTWKYKNTIYVDEYDDYGNLTTKSVNSDGLFGLDFFCGTGIDINQTKRKHLGLEITPGIQIWFPITTQGFKNNYFYPYFYLKVGIVFDALTK